MSVFHIILALHVLGGSIALLAGPIPMLAPKGGRLHRKAGRVFCIAMAGSAFAALVMALMIADRMLLTIAVLTGFLIFSGMRAIRFRRGARPGWSDDAGCFLLIGFGCWLLWRSIAPADITGLFFGLGSILLAVRQWLRQRGARPDWLLAHIAGLGGAYVATVTAFIVVNAQFLPKPVAFIVPSLIGTLLISLASIRYASRPNSPARMG